MSNLGVRILYGLINNIPDALCERVFACDADMEKILRLKNKELLSLDSGRRLSDFDFLGFSLGSELLYTNILNILELANIPLAQSERKAHQPLVIAGGPCVLNPEPLHEFFDLFIIGEAEEVIVELLDAYRGFKQDFKSGSLDRQELLFKLSGIEGVYVPSLYEVEYDGRKLKEFKAKVEGAPLKIKKRFIKNLDTSYFPEKWMVPYIQIIHDRITLEIMRGCPNRCRFCQSRSQYYPLRLRSKERIMDLADATFKASGYEEISLGGLSVSDYPQIKELLQSLLSEFKSRCVSISLPSIKAKALVGGLSALISTVKKTGLTFAPEAGSERLRQILAKDFNEEEFMRSLEESFSAGYQHLKLYFMFGLPGEKEEDLDGIIDLAQRSSSLRKKTGRPPAQVNISINPLIPKPHTVFQWLAMDTSDSLNRKESYLKYKLKNRRIKLNFHNLEMSFLEGVLSRGDRMLSAVILRAFKKGARFDAWSSHFNFKIWQDSFRESGIAPEPYLEGKSKDEVLAWEFIDTGINKEALVQEFDKSIDM